MQPHAWKSATVLTVALLAACLPLAARILVGPPGARVHVRWQPALEPAAIQRLETRFRLADGQRLDASTWRYQLIDPSSDNIRAIVSDPTVVDTHDIDRQNYSLAPSAIRTARQLRFAVGGDIAVRAVDSVSILLAALAGLLVGLGISGREQTPRAVQEILVRAMRSMSNAARTTTVPVARFLSRGIPDIDAQTAGVFRVAFGMMVLVFFVSYQEDAWALTTGDPLIQGELHALVLQWLRDNPYIVDFLTPWLLIMGLAFTAGIFTRLTYALFVTGVFVWLFLVVTHASTHPHSILALALVALLPSRWGDGFSVDNWLRRRRGQEQAARPASKGYGYSVWVPGLVFGVGYAAAAWAKLAPGFGWVLNGSVKYHFITDSPIAPFDWGLQLAHYPRLAIGASLLVVATEALVVTAAFARSQTYRLVMGLGGLSLLSGFWLFMGHFWPAWWILLLAFLPWQYLSRLSLKFRLKRDTTSEPALLTERGAVTLPTRAQLVGIGFIIAQQIVFSTLAIERAPMFTHYPMYSHTFASPAEFDAWFPPYHRIVVSTDRGNVELNCNAEGDFLAEFRAALDGSAVSGASVWRAIRGCRGRPDISGARYATIEEDRRVFDWDRLTLTTMRGVAVLGPLTAHPIGVTPTAY